MALGSIVKAVIGATGKAVASAAASGLEMGAEATGRTVGAAMVLKNQTMPGGFRGAFMSGQGQGQQIAITSAASSSANKAPQG